MSMLFALLTKHNIPYQRCDHPPVFTLEEAEAVVPPMPGADLKNLFLTNRQGSRYFLVTVRYEARVDLKGLAALLGEKKLTFAAPERLMYYLGVEPGALSLLAVVNDPEGKVEVVVDGSVWQAETLKCHPLVNMSTVSMGRESVEQVLALTNHPLTIIDVP